jgi:hypothetical protein
MQAPPTAATIQAAPVFRAMTQATQGVIATADMFKSGGQYSNQQMMEILSRHSINRSVKTLIFEMAAGVKTNRAGEIVEENTRDLLGITARILGGSKMTTQKLQETAWRQKSTEMTQQALRDRMSQSFRSKARSGNLEIEDMQQMVADYMKSGGNPQYFSSWMRHNLLIAKITKYDRKYMELLKSKKGEEFIRFMSIMQPEITESEE